MDWKRALFLLTIVAAMGVVILPSRAKTPVEADDPPAPKVSHAHLAIKTTPRKITRDEFIAMMPKVARWLGVTCGYCHDLTNFKKMTAKKQIALYMRDEFMAKLQTTDGDDITCFTCHQGHAKFLQRDE